MVINEDLLPIRPFLTHGCMFRSNAAACNFGALSENYVAQRIIEKRILNDERMLVNVSTGAGR